MVSMGKRMEYVSENEFSSTEGEDSDYNQQRKKPRMSTSRVTKNNAKWLSKNAIMARENRLKKKIYVSNLENEVEQLKVDNDKYTKVIDNQSMLITDLKNEIKYLKSVIANSSDIGNLIRNIHQSTGMSVKTSLDATLSLNNVLVSKRKQPIARKTAHPWDETEYASFPTPESGTFCSPHSDNGINDFCTPDLLFNDDDDLKLDDFLEMPDNLVDTIDITNVGTEKLHNPHLTEHNYTSTFKNEEQIENDVGVCLHVSKHRVSLEFCSSCSANSSQTWKEQENV